ncbi:hypothetical protein AB6A40_005516 [Gnathostoma spinigerum]|uniref:Uncharacterized protein n=1 Tax=Gnathostoma spinigerum TaxID=75299 RepID=A0ABD6EHV8_9BILA
MIIKNRGRSQFSKKAEIDAERIFTAVERISSGSPEYVHFSAFVDIISVLRMFYLQPNSFRSKVRFEKNFLFSQFERNRQQYQLQLSAILTMMRKKFSVCT